MDEGGDGGCQSINCGLGLVAGDDNKPGRLLEIPFFLLARIHVGCVRVPEVLLEVNANEYSSSTTVVLEYYVLGNVPAGRATHTSAAGTKTRTGARRSTRSRVRRPSSWWPTGADRALTADLILPSRTVLLRGNSGQRIFTRQFPCCPPTTTPGVGRSAPIVPQPLRRGRGR
jgi:hypothetical protein